MGGTEKIKTTFLVKLLQRLNGLTKFLTGNVVLAFLAVCLIVLFYDDVKVLFDSFIVGVILSKLKTAWYRDAIILALSGAYVGYFVSIGRSYRPSLTGSLTIIVTIFIYTYTRFFCDDYIFYSFAAIEPVYYADIVFLSGIIPIMYALRGKKDKPKEKTKAFLTDDPLEHSMEDILGFGKYAKSIAPKILNTNARHAFAIGVNAKWGFGKTSFINLLKEQLGNKDVIEIDFSPWSTSDAANLIRDFFGVFRDALDRYHYAASPLLRKYADKLVAIHENSATKVIQSVVNILTGSESIDSMRAMINTVLKEIDRKIVVYIDDLDRLDKIEILEVIRLIRNTANFHNTIFVVAYDRDYIITAIEELNMHRTDRYLEKIFQLEVNLPYFDSEILREKLYEKLCESLDKQFHETFKAELIGDSSADPRYLNDWIFSMRDVTRLYNSMTLNLTNLIGEVDFGDFLRIEILRVNYPSVYELLHRQTERFLESKGSEFERYRYMLKGASADNTVSALQEYLKNNSSDLSVNGVAIDRIMSLCRDIFADKKFRYFNKSIQSIIYPANFLRYFAYGLRSEDLSDVEFSKYRTGDLESFQKAIRNCVESGKELALATRFKETREFDGPEDFKRIIQGIFTFANLKSRIDRFHVGNIVGYEDRDFISKVYNGDNRLQKKLFPRNEDFESLRTFMKEMFGKAQSPYTFEGDLIREINSAFSEDPDALDYILSRNEYKSIVLGYFRAYLDSREKFEVDIWHVFHFCEYKKFTPEGTRSWTSSKHHFDEAKEMLRDFIVTKDLDGFIEYIIHEERMHGNSFAVTDGIRQIFDDWHTFRSFIFSVEDPRWKYLEEFKQFYPEFEKNDPKLYIPYSFQVIPVRKSSR